MKAHLIAIAAAALLSATANAQEVAPLQTPQPGSIYIADPNVRDVIMRMLKFDAEQTQAVLVLTQRLMEAEARINELSRSYGCAAGQERSPK